MIQLIKWLNKPTVGNYFNKSGSKYNCLNRLHVFPYIVYHGILAQTFYSLHTFPMLYYSLPMLYHIFYTAYPHLFVIYHSLSCFYFAMLFIVFHSIFFKNK